MRIRRHHEHHEHQDQEQEPAPPAWVADKPVWSIVHIEAPRARELADRMHDEHLPHAAA